MSEDGEVLSPRVERLLAVLRAAQDPVGARHAARLLAAEGVPVSEAGASRALAELDARGLTRPVGRKGRVLTRRGRERAAATTAGRRLAAALDIRTAGQLVHWLRARRAIETEAAMAAATRADAAGLARLTTLAAEHDAALATATARGPALAAEGDPAVPAERGAAVAAERGQALAIERDPVVVAVRFQAELLSLAGSPLLLALAAPLHTEPLARAEHMLAVLTGARESQAEIARAVRARDAEAAADAVRDRIDGLVARAAALPDEHAPLLRRLLRLPR
ncbi:winged-helix domain-containing protein [Spongiactinospora gelatinilytica]|nr:winged-helix domain-containing protein [Spongiactinospora gelatinilytica]